MIEKKMWLTCFVGLRHGYSHNLLHFVMNQWDAEVMRRAEMAWLVSWQDYGLNIRGIEVRVHARASDSFLLHITYTGPSASNSIDSGVLRLKLPGRKGDHYTGCPGRNVPDFGTVFLTLKDTDITQDTYIRSWTVTEIMAREKCVLLAVSRTVPVSRVVTRTLRMSVLQSHSRVKHIQLINRCHCYSEL